MKILFTTFCSPEYAPLGDLVLPARINYCKKHGYGLHVQRTPVSDRGPGWDKTIILQTALQHADVVVWYGLDVLFMNQSFRVETILDQYPKASVILTTDFLGLNSDNMIFRRDAWSAQLLAAVNTLGYPFFKGHIWAEQEALIRFISAPPYAEHIAWVPQNTMNSYLNDVYGRPTEWPGHYQPGDWLIHLPGLPMPKRLELARKYLRLHKAAEISGNVCDETIPQSARS